ncbi:hypothetical protein B0H13DRAFT_1116174 [Mycena leptocephala]|nr:hypothetical protein B0H13DRAFT_1116174 [Mycena leptocephala]
MSPHSQSATTPREQCLQNSDLLDQILLLFLPSLGSQQTRSVQWHKWGIRDTRNTLHSTALTSRAFYHSAIPLLWRRLDNLVPLLRLLPSFKMYYPEQPGGFQTHYPGQRARVNGFYYLPGIIEDTDWLVFDRHANYVREIIHIKSTVSPTVYTRLAMRKSILLPNLSLFKYGEYAVDDHTIDLILYVSPSLVSVSLPALAPATETFLNMLSNHPPPLSHLCIYKHPTTVLSFCSIYRNLQSVSFMGLTGPVAQADFLALASLPLLQSLTTDMYGWHKVNFHSIPFESIFCALIYLKIDGALLYESCRILPLLIPRIGAISIVSISVVCEDRRYRALEIPTAGPETFAEISSAIATRWSTTLQDLHITGLPCTTDEFSAFLGLTHIRTFELRRGLNGPLNDARILAVICNWTELTSLTIEGADADIEIMKCLALHCHALHFLHVDFFPDPLPDISTTPVLSHALAKLEFSKLETMSARWKLVDMHLLASHLDHLFPQLLWISADGWDHRWHEVEQLVMMMQEKRRAV